MNTDPERFRAEPRPRHRSRLLAAVTALALAGGGLAAAAPAQAAPAPSTEAPVVSDPGTRLAGPGSGAEIFPGGTSIEGIFRYEQVLTITTSAWNPANTSLSYVWTRDGAAIPGATGSTYQLQFADIGKIVAARVTGSAPGYTSVMLSLEGTKVESGDITSVEPKIIGSVKVGETVTVDPGTWGPGYVDYAYQWVLDNMIMSGATGASYTITEQDAADTGKPHFLSVTVSGTKLGYGTRSHTSPTARIGLAEMQKSADPFITGTPTVGETLTAHAPALAPEATTVRYQWIRNFFEIEGATGPQYRLTAADAGQKVHVLAYATRAGHTPLTLPSGELSIASATFDAAPAPTISGAVRVGAPLTAEPGAWAPTPDGMSYQWLRDGVEIPGATSSTYTPGAADRGHRISVETSGSKAGYATQARASGEVLVPAAVAVSPRKMGSVAPKISGTAKVGKKLTVRRGGWTPSGVSYSYRWKRNGKAIRGATKASYTLGKKDRRTRITVTVTGRKTGYVTVSRTSKSVRVR